MRGAVFIFLIKTMEKTFYWYVVFILLCIWQLPQLLVALIMYPFLGRKRVITRRHYNICIEGEYMRGGISLGPIAYVSPKLSDLPASVAHETDGHTVQSKRTGWLYLIIYGIPSILWAWYHDSSKGCYYEFYTEKSANEFAGLEVDENCRLKFKK